MFVYSSFPAASASARAGEFASRCRTDRARSRAMARVGGRRQGQLPNMVGFGPTLLWPVFFKIKRGQKRGQGPPSQDVVTESQSETSLHQWVCRAHPGLEPPGNQGRVGMLVSWPHPLSCLLRRPGEGCGVPAPGVGQAAREGQCDPEVPGDPR